MISVLPDQTPEQFADYTGVSCWSRTLVKKAQTVPIECIVRGYLIAFWQKTYDQTVPSAVLLPDGLTGRHSGVSPLSQFTPSTKA